MDSDDAPHDNHLAAPVPAAGEGATGSAVNAPLHDDQGDCNASSTSDQHTSHLSDAQELQGESAQAEGPAQPAEDAQVEGAEGDGKGRSPIDDKSPSTAASHATPSATVEEDSIVPVTTSISAPSAQAVPFQPVFTVPRPASLTSRITEQGSPATTTQHDTDEMRAYVEKHLGVRTANEQDPEQEDAAPTSSSSKPMLHSLDVLASATRSFSAPIPNDGPDEAMGHYEPPTDLGGRKRPRSEDGNIGEGEIRENGKEQQGFEPFPPGWHLANKSLDAPLSSRGATVVTSSGEGKGEEGDHPPVAQRRRTEGPAFAAATHESTAQLTDAQEWHLHYYLEQALRQQALAAAHGHGAAHSMPSSSATAAGTTSHPALLPSQLSYYSSYPAQTNPHIANATNRPLTNNPNSAFSGSTAVVGGGAAADGGTPTTPSTHWFAKGSLAEQYYYMTQSERQAQASGALTAARQAAQEVGEDGGTASFADGQQQQRQYTRSGYDSPHQQQQQRQQQQQPAYDASWWYHGGSGIPSYVYQQQQSTPQQHSSSSSTARVGATYQRPFPHPMPTPPQQRASVPREEANASSPSAEGEMSGSTSGPSGGGGDWFMSPGDGRSTTVTDTTADTSTTSHSTSRSSETTQPRKPIPMRTRSSSRAQAYIASVTATAGTTSAAVQSAAYGSGYGEVDPFSVAAATAASRDGEEAPQQYDTQQARQSREEGDERASSVASGSAAGAAIGAVDTPSPATSQAPQGTQGGGGGAGRKGRKSAPQNAYAIQSIAGMKPFICKLRWLLQNPQEVGEAVRWSNDGSAVLVKIGGDDTKLKEVLLRTFSHENPGAFMRQFAVYGFTPIKDADSLAEVLDPATQPATIWRAYEDTSGTFYRENMDDLDALKGMVAKKKGPAAAAAAPASTTSTPQMQAQVQTGASIPVLPGYEALPPLPTPGTSSSAAASSSASGFPVLSQGYPPSASSSSSGYGTSQQQQSAAQQHYYQHQHQQQGQSTASAAQQQYARIAPAPAPGPPATLFASRSHEEEEKGDDSSGDGSAMRDLLQQAANIPRMGGLAAPRDQASAVKGLLRTVVLASNGEEEAESTAGTGGASGGLGADEEDGGSDERRE
ncbi:hypothetical protein JCM10908_004537 [Rhodotorula pacifica]|uniref:uncharacterized protein n=1 Tax=Rhodotorula pacifica TaxID=1495444 RepID=UPI00316E697D